MEDEPLRYLVIVTGMSLGTWFVTFDGAEAINQYLKLSFDPWESSLDEVYDLESGEQLTFELEIKIHLAPH